MNNISKNSTEKIIKGVQYCTSLIKPTYGGNGTNVIIESNLYPYHMVVNDAQSIVQPIKVKDRVEKIGVDFIKELCDKADKVSGDARKTTILIGESILLGGFGSANKKKLKKELDALIPFVENKIDEVTTNITADNVKNVATTASESEETGELFQKIYSEIGKNGIITVEGSKTYETSYKITNGVRFEGTGMLSPEMVHDEEAIKEKHKETKAIYYNPYILVTKKKITNEDDINPLLVELRNLETRDLVIFTQDMDSGVASMLISLHKSKEYNILIVKAPVLWQNFVFEDFAKCTGATVIEDATGKNFKNMSISDLGRCGRIEVDSEDCILTGIKDISDHCKMLAEKGDDDSILRLTWLANKSAVIRLGSNSHTDLSYKRLKANDANRSTYLALQYGIVKGGGITLYDIADTLPDTEAGNILKEALKAPYRQAKENYGVTDEEYRSIITDSIVDSSMVVKRAVRNAIGVASTIITAPDTVYIPELTPEEMSYQVAFKQNNPFGQ